MQNIEDSDFSDMDFWLATKSLARELLLDLKKAETHLGFAAASGADSRHEIERIIKEIIKEDDVTSITPFLLQPILKDPLSPDTALQEALQRTDRLAKGLKIGKDDGTMLEQVKQKLTERISVHMMSPECASTRLDPVRSYNEKLFLLTCLARGANYQPRHA